MSTAILLGFLRVNTLGLMSFILLFKFIQNLGCTIHFFEHTLVVVGGTYRARLFKINDKLDNKSLSFRTYCMQKLAHFAQKKSFCSTASKNFS